MKNLEYAKRIFRRAVKITDGCTGIPGTPDLNNWALTDCCISHDLEYRGLGDHKITRSKADRNLRMCIVDAGYPIFGWIVWAIVRMTGWRSWKRR